MIAQLLKDKKLLIFDCDGVLFQSKEANIAYINRCLELGGHPPIEEKNRFIASHMSVKQLLHTIIENEKEAERVFKISQQLDYEPFIPLLKPCFDFPYTLNMLKSRFTLAIASNRAKSLSMLARHFSLTDYFEYIISSLDAKPKPDPEMLTVCMKYFLRSRKETLFIGDTISDKKAAVAAGVDFLWVGNADEKPNVSSVEEMLAFFDI